MATFRVQRVDLEEEKLFSKRGKARKSNQRKITQKSTVKIPGASSTPQQNFAPPAGSTLQLNPSDFQQSNSVINSTGNKQTVVQSKVTQSGSTNNQDTINTGNNSITDKPLSNIKPENVVIGQQPTGQQGTTGNVDWGRLGGDMKKWTWNKAKPLVIGAGLATAAAAAGTIYAANKAGKAIAKGADELEDRLEENRRWRREERMAKRLLKAGYNPYQEGQRIGGYAFTNPYPGRLR